MAGTGGLRAEEAIWTPTTTNITATTAIQLALPANTTIDTTSVSTTGKQVIPVGYVRDRYLTAFQTAIGLALTLRLSIAGYATIKTGNILYKFVVDRR